MLGKKVTVSMAELVIPPTAVAMDISHRLKNYFNTFSVKKNKYVSTFFARLMDSGFCRYHRL
jgi:hypothetical protein